MGVEAHSKQRKQCAEQATELAWTAQITEMASAAGTQLTAGVGVRG